MSVRRPTLRLVSLGCALLLVAVGGAIAQTGKSSKPRVRRPTAAEKAAAAKAAEEEAAAAKAAAEEAAALKAAADKVEYERTHPRLAYNWRGVASARYKVSTLEETTTTDAKGPSVNSQERELIVGIDTDGTADKGRTWVVMHYVQLKFKVMPQGIEFDTAAAENPRAGPLAPAPKVFAAIKEAPLKLLVWPSGVVDKIEGLPRFIEVAKLAWAAAPMRDQLLPLVIPMSEESVRDQFASAMMRLPGRRAAVGDSIPQKQTLPNGAGELNGAFAFQSVDGQPPEQVAVVVRTLSAPPLPPQANPADKLVYVRDKYDIASTERLSTTTGVPVSYESKIEVKYSARKEGADPSTAPDKLVQQLTRVETTLLDFQPAAPPPGAPSTTAPSQSAPPTQPPPTPPPAQPPPAQPAPPTQPPSTPPPAQPPPAQPAPPTQPPPTPPPAQPPPAQPAPPTQPPGGMAS